jgi:N-acyl-D-amino-acid deacylase
MRSEATRPRIRRSEPSIALRLALRIALCLIGLLIAVAVPRASAQTGVPVPALQTVDEAITQYMARWSLPGGAVAITYRDKLIFARGYGFADVEHKRPVEPDTPFRLGSVGKPITAAAIMKLVEQGKLKLDGRMIDALGRSQATPEHVAPGVDKISIQNLLQHTSGWGPEDTGYGADVGALLARLGASPPSRKFDALLSAALAESPRFTPGSRFDYSTFGYCVLGAIIEKSTGQSFEAFARKTLLAPAGANGMRLARRAQREAWPGEATYYDFPDAPVSGEHDDTGRPVPRPYAYWGGLDGECNSGGRWVASTIDYMRFLLALTGRRGTLLAPAMLRLMDDRFSEIRTGPGWYDLAGLGWVLYIASDGDIGWAHSGSLPGSMAHVVHSFRGEVWIVVFNSRPRDDTAYPDLIRTMSAALHAAGPLPEQDLFERYPSSPAPN